MKSWQAAALALGLALAGCGVAPANPTATPASAGASPEALRTELVALPPGDATAGQALFSAVGCVVRHSLEPGVRIVGPSLAGMAARAAARKAGYSAQLYLYESITRPNAYVVEGFPSGVMPQGFKHRLKPQELANVIAFLLTEQ
jgi:cytochrome c